MNRIILIGNGFDLAMGLKTSYKDFILWYLRKLWKKIPQAKNSKVEEDNKEPNYYTRLITWEWKTIEDIQEREKITPKCPEVFDEIINGFYNFKMPGRKGAHSPFYILRNQLNFTIRPLLEKIFICFRSNKYNWVDIEKIYYEFLCEIISNQSKYSTEENYKDAIHELNASIDELREALREYLQLNCSKGVFQLTDDNKQKKYLYKRYLDFFFEENTDQINELAYGIYNLNSTYFINFNYTDTLQFFNQKKEMIKKENIIHIHGHVNDYNYPMIFGYGDELDTRHKKMLDLDNNYLLSHIKSVNYLLSSSYEKLLKLINSAEFDVFIFGHSCGLSDRVLLNTIFENDNCKKIRVFYYKPKSGPNNFKDISINLSRHFNNPAIFRNKVHNFNYSYHMPQHDD